MGTFYFSDFSIFPRPTLTVLICLKKWKLNAKCKSSVCHCYFTLDIKRHNEEQINQLLLFDEIDLFKEPYHDMQVIFAIVQRHLKSKVSSQ